MPSDPKQRAFNKLIALKPLSIITHPDQIVEDETLRSLRAVCNALLKLPEDERRQVLKALEAFDG